MTTAEKETLDYKLSITETDDIESIARKWKNSFKELVDGGESAEKAIARLTEYLNKRVSNLTAGNSDKGKRKAQQLSESFTEALKNIQKEAEKAAEAAQKVTKAFGGNMSAAVTSGFAPFKHLSAKGLNVGGLLDEISRTSPALKGFTEAFSNVKGIWSFAEGISKINSHLYQLQLTSGMGADALSSLGAAATAFGGSADTVAAGQERFNMQIERMKRGGGMGHFGEVAYKYGFMTDFNADYQTNTRRAVEHAANMGSDSERRAFLNALDPSRAKELMGLAKMDRVQREEYYGFFDNASKWGDQEEANQATVEFNQEMAKLQRTWQATTNELATTFLPVMKGLAQAGRFVLSIWNQMPGVFKLVIAGGTALGISYRAGKAVIGTYISAKQKLIAATATASAALQALASSAGAAATANATGAVASNAGVGARGMLGKLGGGQLAAGMLAVAGVAYAVNSARKAFFSDDEGYKGNARADEIPAVEKRVPSVPQMDRFSIMRTFGWSPNEGIQNSIQGLDANNRSKALESFQSFLKAVEEKTKEGAKEIQDIGMDNKRMMLEYEYAKYNQISNNVNNNQRSVTITNNIQAYSTGSKELDAALMADTLAEASRNLGLS